MRSLANFCFKYKANVNGKTIKCRITIDLVEVSPLAYQVITKVYEGIKLINTLGSNVDCYSYSLDVFYNTITRKNVNRILITSLVNFANI